METNNPLLIAIDAGHGGQDSGAQSGGRLEKDDNLRLALALRDALMFQGVDVLMTRDRDVAVSPQDRVRTVNNSDAELLVSLHRGFCETPDSTCNGAENYIYLTAPEATTGRAAQTVLDEVARVGVQADRGVRRGNYYLLRRANMPAMMLNLGYISDATDNQLFDQKLLNYAEAITKGIMEYFGLTYIAPPVRPVPPIGTLPPTPTPPVQPVPPIGSLPPVQPTPPIGTLPPVRPTPPIGTLPVQPTPLASRAAARPGWRERVAVAQRALNDLYGFQLADDGTFGSQTKQAAVRVLQREINSCKHAGLAEDGVLGPKTQALLPTLRQGDQGSFVRLLQLLLMLNGYDPGATDGFFGPQTRTAVTTFQRDNFLVPDGVAGPRTFVYLLR